MVCLGNICRSPLAEGILKTKVQEHGLDWEVDSAGTGAYHAGELPDERSIAVAKKYGIDLTDQRARQFRQSDFSDFDLIYVMDAENYRNVLRLTNIEAEARKVIMLMNEAYPNENRRVPDPYYGGANGFENIYEMIDLACDKIIESHS